jgi:hypothetical protein
VRKLNRLSAAIAALLISTTSTQAQQTDWRLSMKKP